MRDTLDSFYEEHLLMDSEEAPTGVLVYYADGDEEIIHVNSYILDLFECETLEEFMDLTGGSFQGFVMDEDVDSAEDSIWGQIEKKGDIDHIYYRIKTKTGHVRTIDDYGKLIRREGKRPIFNVFIAEMAQTATVDWLTGLPSMKRFHSLAAMGAQTMKARGQRPVAVALDLMGLKDFNSQYGHDSGDDLLRVFADELRKFFGSEACSRFAEDHFYAFAAEDAIKEKLDALFCDFENANGGRVLPVRVGVYACDEGDDIVTTGFDRAKFACDLDRTSWHSHYVWFTDQLRLEARRRIHVLENLDRAIAEGWIKPYYQAQVRTATSCVCGEEALARWDDPEFGLLSPDVFVPVLEEARLLHKLDIHIVDCVLKDIKARREAGLSAVPISVNISLRDLGQLDIADEIIKRVDAAGEAHELICIEFTETAAYDDADLFRNQVEALREAGFQVWMDDFGSGYSSFNILQEYTLDLIKLDMDLIRNIKDPQAYQVVKGVIAIANSLGMNTLAEGVETQEEAILLEQAGCNIAQGYLYSRPRSMRDLFDALEAGALLPREPIYERAYWDSIGSVVLSELSSVAGRTTKQSHVEELPAAILEHREGTWITLRANAPYLSFLSDRHSEYSTWNPLHAREAARGVDKNFERAANRSHVTGDWVQVSGKLEYGSGLQFFTKPIASTDSTEAFAVGAVESMLGSALGSYGDVPVAYAVLRVIPDTSHKKLRDAEYVFANAMYCRICKYEQQSIAGASFSKLSPNESALWLSRFYQAAIRRQEVHDVVYSSEIEHWISFSVVPTTTDGCVAYAFSIADDEQRQRQEIIMDLNTSDLVISMANVLNGDKSHEEAMQTVLQMAAEIIHADRIYVLETGGGERAVTYGWKTDEAEPAEEALMAIPDFAIADWRRLLKVNETIVVPDMESIRETDPESYVRFNDIGVRNAMAAPLFGQKKLFGYLMAMNYHNSKTVDASRLIKGIAAFIASRIFNHRLVIELENTSMYDGLTGLRNRWGIDSCVEERLGQHPDEPFVLALMDVDDFKTMNDLHGHDVGDEVLRMLAQKLRDMFAEDAILGRNGGDEFLVMMFGDDALRADELFEELSTCKKSCVVDGESYNATMSIGYVGYPNQADSVKSAYAMADEALYAVKLQGKSGFKRYSGDLEAQYRTLLGFSSRDLADNIPGGIMVHKAQDPFEILFINDELMEMMNCTSLAEFMDYTGGTNRGLLHPDDIEAVGRALARHAEKGGTGTKSFSGYRFVTKDGKVVNVAANSRLVEVDGFGKLFYVIIVDREDHID